MEMTGDRTALERLILDIVLEADDALTRNDIAQAMGRPRARLNPYDIRILEALAEEGVIEAKLITVGTVQQAWVYKSA